MTTPAHHNDAHRDPLPPAARPSPPYESKTSGSGARPTPTSTVLGKLDYSAMISFRSWTEVVAAYSERGIVCSSDEELFARVKSDWRALREPTILAALREPIPVQFPSTLVDVGGERIEIFGILHTPHTHPEVRARQNRAFGNSALILTEQGLGYMSGGRYSNGMELPDHFARGLGSLLLDYEKAQVIALGNVLKSLYRKVTRRPTLLAHTDADYLNAISDEGKEIQRRQRWNPFFNKEMAAWTRVAMHLPGGWNHDYPPNISIAYKHEKGIPYNRVEARSAYMAEFLRAWNMQKMVELIAERDGGSKADPSALAAMRKRLLCGQGHQDQVRTFLEVGSRDDAVTQRAKRDAQNYTLHGSRALANLRMKQDVAFFASQIPLVAAKLGGLFLLLARAGVL